MVFIRSYENAMTAKRARSVLLTDAEYEACKKSAGKAGFSDWARKVIFEHLSAKTEIPGTTPGGVCPRCENGESWFFSVVDEIYVCENCVPSNDAEKYENRLFAKTLKVEEIQDRLDDVKRDVEILVLSLFAALRQNRSERGL